MSLGLVRAGRSGEHIQRFLDGSRICFTWYGLDHGLSQRHAKSDEDLRAERPLERSGTLAIQDESE
jgi:hypothetical protein